MTDPSTSPVPPNPEIEGAIAKVVVAAGRLWLPNTESSRVVYGGQDSRRKALSIAEQNLRSAIASYTLSPEEARALHTLLSGSAVNELRFSMPGLGPKLRRIASTEEASQ